LAYIDVEPVFVTLYSVDTVKSGCLK